MADKKPIKIRQVVPAVFCLNSKIHNLSCSIRDVIHKIIIIIQKKCEYLQTIIKKFFLFPYILKNKQNKHL